MKEEAFCFVKLMQSDLLSLKNHTSLKKAGGNKVNIHRLLLKQIFRRSSIW